MKIQNSLQLDTKAEQGEWQIDLGHDVVLSVPTDASWLQLDGENDKAYTFFRGYLEMGRPRSMKRYSETLDISYESVRIYSHKFGWRKRASDYDAYCEEVAKESKKAVLRQFASDAMDDYKRSRQLIEGLWGKILPMLNGSYTVPTKEIRDLARTIKEVQGILTPLMDVAGPEFMQQVLQINVVQVSERSVAKIPADISDGLSRYLTSDDALGKYELPVSVDVVDAEIEE